MGELSRRREAVEEAVRKGEDTWPHWQRYAEELASFRKDNVLGCIDTCIDTYVEAGDFHGTAVVRHIGALVTNIYSKED